MTTREVAVMLGCTPGHVGALVARKKLISLGGDVGVTEESVREYLATRRLRRVKLPESVSICFKRLPRELVDRFRAAVPGGSSVTMCMIDAMELWLEKREND